MSMPNGRARWGGCGSARWRWGVGIFMAWTVMTSPAQAQTDLVEITGGADETLHNYLWVVTNRHSSPIVEIEFPHFRADLFLDPDHLKGGDADRWEQETKNLVNVGVPDEPGYCIARVRPPYLGILSGRSEDFGMRVAPARAYKGRGTVKVTFADGKVVTVPGVELPEPPQSSEQYAALIGAGVLFALVVVAHQWRKRKSPRAAREPD